MKEYLRLILLMIPIIAGAVSIFLAFQMMKRYKEAFVNSYFYYLVFLYIFGTYSLIGTGILEQLFLNLETDQEIIQSARLFMILLGIPFLVLSKYMLIRFVIELFRKKLILYVAIIYFTIGAAALVLYGFFSIRLTRFDLGEYEMMVSVQRLVFSVFMICVYAAVFVVLLFMSRNRVEHEKRFSRAMGLLYLLYIMLCTAAFTLSGLHEIIPFVFVFFLLSWHLIPILFMNLYLEKYHGQTTSVQHDFEALLNQFSDRFEISKREKEVISLISKGLSNQEISEALFISLQTVKDHIHHIFVKTGVKNRVQLTNLIRSEK
jgi:DNA-binding CsgD family transcriptional regulator